MARIWIDIDNPPQAQYLTPVGRAMRELGHDVLVTAREHPPTLEILRQHGEAPVAVGATLGRSYAAKALGTLRRVPLLARTVLRRWGRPQAVLSSGRAAVLTAAVLRVPAFAVLDYEAVDIGAYRWSRTTILHPAIVPAQCFSTRGFPPRRLVAFPGMKEDLTFAGIASDAVMPVELPSPVDPAMLAVLVRPPSQTSHYRAQESVVLLGAVLDELSTRDGVQVVFSPREAEQVALLGSREWRHPPVVLERPLPLVALLRRVSWVVTGGGTLLREAAWMGVPGVSVFQGPPAAVDTWLEQQGVVRRLRSPEDARDVPWNAPGAVSALPRHPEALDVVVSTILAGIGAVEQRRHRGSRA